MHTPWYRRLILWTLRRMLNWGVVDWSIKQGDWVTTKHWSYHALEVIDVNWALLAVAVRLYGKDGRPGGIVVWPIHGMKKI